MSAVPQICISVLRESSPPVKDGDAGESEAFRTAGVVTLAQQNFYHTGTANKNVMVSPVEPPFSERLHLDAVL